MARRAVSQWSDPAKLDGKCRVRVSVPVTVLCADNPVKFATPEEDVIEFDARAGQTYTLHSSKNQH